MEINRRIAELESVFPLAGVDDGYILSRSGDVTVGWELTLPTAFTVDRASYDAMLRSMASAIRALPDWTMVHRQDIYLDRTYKGGREGCIPGQGLRAPLRREALS